MTLGEMGSGGGEYWDGVGQVVYGVGGGGSENVASSLVVTGFRVVWGMG